MTELQDKLDRICVLAENLINEPVIELCPKAVSKDRVTDSAYLIREYALEVMDELATVVN